MVVGHHIGLAYRVRWRFQKGEGRYRNIQLTFCAVCIQHKRAVLLFSLLLCWWQTSDFPVALKLPAFLE